jgi:outer membrane receptor protein involved in Fe transport
MTCDRSARGGRAGVPGGPLRWGATAVLLLLLVPAVVRAQSSWRYDHDISLSYEFDDNVQERLREPVEAQLARVGYHGDLIWGGGEQRLGLRYQGGFKRHFGDVPVSGDTIPSQFVNEGTVTYLRKVTPRLALGAEVGLKHRVWTKDSFFLINEDGFLQRSGGLNAIVDLEPLDAEHQARLNMSLNWTDTEYKFLDPHFGSSSVSAYASVTKEFGENVDATASYSYDRIRFPGRATLEPGDLPQNILSPQGERQQDQLHELGGEVHLFGPVSIVADYRFRYNDSNSFGFRYVSHSLGIQLLRPLPWGMLAQVLGQVELRSYLEPVPKVTAGSLDTGEAQDNVLLLRLVKDITPDYSVEARYARYRNESITLNEFYTKNVWSVGMIYRP